jgi:hypothetical protein
VEVEVDLDPPTVETTAVETTAVETTAVETTAVETKAVKKTAVTKTMMSKSLSQLTPMMNQSTNFINSELLWNRQDTPSTLTRNGSLTKW